MERNDSEVTSAANSWVDQYEDPQYYNMQNVPLDHTGFVQYSGSNLNWRPIQYVGPMPVFRHREGYMINTTHPFYNHDLRNGAVFLAYGLQFHKFRQPMFRRNPIWFQDGLHAAKNFWYRRRTAATYFRGQHIHRPESVVDNSLWFRSGYNNNNPNNNNIYERNQSTCHTRGRINFQHPFSGRNTATKSNFSTSNWDVVNGYSLLGCTNVWYWSLKSTQNTYHGANLNQSNFPPMVQSLLHQNNPQPEDYSLSKGSNGGDTGCCIREDTYRDLATEENIGSEQNYSQKHPGYNSVVGTNSTKSSVVSSTLRTLGSTLRAKQTASQGNIRCSKLIQSIRYRALRIRVGNRKALVPRLVWLKKIKAQAAAIHSGRSNIPIYHITWDGSEPGEQKCLLCNHELSYAQTGTGYEYFVAFPDVAVLSCGHVFHSQCFELATLEDQSTDPPCFVCLSCTEN